MQELVIGFLTGAFCTSVVSLIVYKFLLKTQKLEFEKLTHEALKTSETGSKEFLDGVLTPFKEKVGEYQKAIEEFHKRELENSAVFKNEMDHVISATKKIELEAHNLTKALKGDVKVQGNWGEMILQRVLELSGLEEGREFTTQGRGRGFKNEEGRTQLPDVLIHLPENEYIVVDSKVSLVAYERYIACNGDEECLKDLKASVKSHIDGLSAKSYQSLEGMGGPDFVLLFIPIENVFSLLMKYDQGILDYGWKKNVIVVTPMTLMAILKTINSLWRVEKQNKNAMEIARKAGSLYDKFFSLISDFDKLGRSIKKLQDDFEVIDKRLHSGRDSLVDKVDKLKELGAQTK